MTTPRRQPPLLVLVALVIAHVRRHPYLYVSVALHAGLLTLMFFYGSHVLALQRQAQQAQQVGVSVQLAHQARTEKRVQDMQTIKSLLEQSASQAPEAAGKAPADGEDEVLFSATSLPKLPQELLQQARVLSKQIDALDKDIKAEELAKLLRIPKEEALEQVDAGPAAPASSAASAPADPDQVAEEIQQLETKARDLLMARQQELDRKEEGVPVASAAAQETGQAAGHESGNNTADAATHNGHKTATGEAGSASGVNDQTAQGQGAGEAKGDEPALGRGAPAARTSPIRKRIAAFINRDALASKQASHRYHGEDVFDHGIGSIPALQANHMSKGSGRLFGAGGEFADRVYVNGWYVIGPFEGKHGRDMFANYSHPPEQGVLLDAVYFGKGKRLLKWQYVSAQHYPLVPPDVVEDAVYYGYTELMMDEAQDLSMWIGADDDVQVWLNDGMVWAGGNINKKWFFDRVYDPQTTLFRDFNLSEGKRVVHFRKGRNKVFFKLANGPNGAFFSMVLTK